MQNEQPFLSAEIVYPLGDRTNCIMYKKVPLSNNWGEQNVNYLRMGNSS